MLSEVWNRSLLMYMSYGKLKYSKEMVWYGMDILFHLGKPLAMRLLYKAPRTVQTQAQ